MKVKDLVRKYGYKEKEGFINISEKGSINISKKTFEYIKQAQELLFEFKEDYPILMKKFRENGEKLCPETQILKQYWDLQCNYQTILMQNNLFF